MIIKNIRIDKMWHPVYDREICSIAYLYATKKGWVKLYQLTGYLTDKNDLIKKCAEAIKKSRISRTGLTKALKLNTQFIDIDTKALPYRNCR